MSQDNLIKLECTECKRVTHHSTKNKKNNKKPPAIGTFS